MELLGAASEIPVELLWVLCLVVVLLLLIDDILELHIASVAVAAACVLTDALVMESVSTHEMDCGQAQRLLAAITLFCIEVFCFGFKVLDLGSHSFDFSHVFIDLLVVLFYDSILYLKSIQEIFLDDFKFEVWFRLEDL